MHTILSRFDPSHSLDSHLNVSSILIELAEQKPIYMELISEKSLRLISSLLDSDCQSTKSNLYLLLSTMALKYRMNTEDLKKPDEFSSLEESPPL